MNEKMRGTMRCIILTLIIAVPLLFIFPFSLAANDPGHDTLYIEETGNSSLTGNLNISEQLKVANLIYSTYIRVQGNASAPSEAATRPNMYAIDNNNLYLNGPTAIYLQKDAGSAVYVGTTSAVTLNVSGPIYSANQLVCLANGTNCVGGNNTGNVTSINAGNGISVSATTGDVTVSANAATCGAGQYSYWTGSAWTCGTPSGAGNISGAGTANYVALWSNSTNIGNSAITQSGSDISMTGDLTVSGGRVTGSNSEYLSIGETNNQIDLYSNGATRLRIDTSNNLGIEGTLYDITNTNVNIDDNLFLQNKFLSFYSTGDELHSIVSKDASTNYADDLRINSYGELIINLDSNNNNANTADFQIGRHGGTGAISDWLFTVGGEAEGATVHQGNLTVSAGSINASGDICTTSGNCLSDISALGSGDITSVTAGTGLTGGGETGDVTLNLNTTYTDERYLLNTGDTATGNYTFDSTTLHIDSSNNRIGIGTVTPSAALHVTTGDVYIFGASNRRFLIGDSTSAGQWGGFRWDTTTDTISFGHSASSANVQNIVIEGTGEVGINDTTPSATLDITGNIGIAGTEVISNSRIGSFATGTTVDSSAVCTAANGLCGGSDTVWSLTGPYLYNNSGSLDVNETKLNATIEALDTDTYNTSAQMIAAVNGSGISITGTASTAGHWLQSTTLSGTGASSVCTYGIANYTLNNGTASAITCAAQQGTVTSITTGTGLTGGVITTSGTVAVNTSYVWTKAGGIPDSNISSAASWNAKAGAGDCASGQIVMNTTASGVECVAASTLESDPQVGTATNTYLCYGTATNIVECNDAGATYAIGTDVLSLGGGIIVGGMSNSSLGDETIFIDASNGRVGIATATPTQALSVVGSANVTENIYVGTAGALFDGGNQGGSLELGGTNGITVMPFIDFHNGTDEDYNVRLGLNQSDVLKLTGGTFRIGDGSPGNASGADDFYVTSDIEYDGNLYGSGADLAEMINASEALEAGDVVEIDPAKTETVRKSSNAYSTRVAGVVSTDPSIILGKSSGSVPLALSGRVPIKVTAENGAITPGDLLTTSSTPGYAMRCASRQECQGAIVAKSLGTLSEGTGKITALVVLG